jgi:16S rRNA (adenine1518-N6/adenine1519-N6)-dimethyltransferase
MTRRRLGQHFLYDPSILKRIIEAAMLSPEDTAVEIGPGHGRLTAMIAERVGRVIAIEIDRVLCESLRTTFSRFGNVEIVGGDALEYPYVTLGEFKVVANIPYSITTPLLFRLLEERGHLLSVTLTIQREVAKRIVAAPGSKEYGILSIMLQYYGKPRIVFYVPKGAFRPVPKVDSAVIHIEVYKKPPLDIVDEELFFKVVRTSFAKRRKTLVNALKYVSEDIRETLLKAGIEPDRRAETVSMSEFAIISDLLSMETQGGRTVASLNEGSA